MTVQATLFVGTRSARLLQANTGYTDDGNAYSLTAVSERIAPAGSDGECLFVELGMTTRHFAQNVSITVTPMVDGVALPSQTISLIGAATTTGNRQTHLLSLYLPYVADLGAGAVEQLRYAPRGTWFSMTIATGGQQVAIEEVNLGYEVVRSTMQPGDTR